MLTLAEAKALIKARLRAEGVAYLAADHIGFWKHGIFDVPFITDWEITEAAKIYMDMSNDNGNR